MRRRCDGCGRGVTKDGEDIGQICDGLEGGGLTKDKAVIFRDGGG